MPVNISSVAVDLVLAGAAASLVAACYRWRLTAVAPSVITFVVVAVAMAAAPGIARPSPSAVDPVVSAALAAILFDGGLEIGRSRLRASWGPILALGVLGTAATAGLGALFVRYVVGLPWYGAVLVATALAPTDPAVVFSVVGRNRPAGRSGSIVEGESGANDPIGIALMAGLLGSGGLSPAGWLHAAVLFGQQMGIGLGAGVIAGAVLARVGPRVRPDTTVAGVVAVTTAAILGLYLVTAAGGGSGFLAVFVAGLLGGSESFPRPRSRRWHSALAGVGEAVAFAALGSTVAFAEVARAGVWLPGLAVGAVLVVVVRPLVVGLTLAPAHLRRAEKAFVAAAGLKGAVPVLLGGRLLTAPIGGRARAYGIVVTAVVFTVTAVGAAMGPLVRKLGLPAAGGTAGTGDE